MRIYPRLHHANGSHPARAGYVTLLAVLIMGAASLIIGVTLLIGGVDSQRSALAAQQSAQARGLADACAEEALQRIHENTSFTGSDGLTEGQGACTFTVADAGGGARTVTAAGTVENVVRKIEVHATIGVSSISIISWQETM